ncbi:hypothetical protein BCR44DRAFT_1436113 [Catenaria anguillulae PL171]|uniref:Uncharacterized protein n=1 Tax=Catenaria anguillulae PL171 TaxID=765915 RepID=A0A1Y2HLR1_9FUNG|nr:hypothetical protein BCR44DRAFT_1436113 [Catenaria anguillulae PL171]
MQVPSERCESFGTATWCLLCGETQCGETQGRKVEPSSGGCRVPPPSPHIPWKHSVKRLVDGHGRAALCARKMTSERRTLTQEQVEVAVRCNCLWVE